MDFFFNSLRKLLTLSLFVAFGFVFTYIPQEYGSYKTVPEAEAQWAVIDAANLAVNTGILANTTIVSSKEIALDNIGWILGKAIVANIVASTVDWINSGFRGSPAFVQDIDRFLLNVADQVAGAYLQELGGPLSFLCSPFRLDIQVALALEYQQARERLPYQGCELSEAFDNFEDFVAGDFLQGGWDDFIQISAQPEKYTEYGARMAASRTISEEIAAQQSAEQESLSYGDGFLSFKTCADVKGPGGQVDRDCKVVTPGKTIATRLSDSLGLSEQSLITADEVNEIIGALISQIAVQAVTGTAGLLGLSANTGYSGAGFDGGSYIDNIRNEAIESQATSIENAASGMENILTIQQDYQDLARSYNAQAQDKVDDPTTDIDARNNALSVIAKTEEVIENAERYIIEIQAALAQYTALEIELTANTADTTRRQEIIDEQRTLVLDVIQGNYYTQSQLETSRITWETMLNPTPPPSS